MKAVALIFGVGVVMLYIFAGSTEMLEAKRSRDLDAAGHLMAGIVVFIVGAIYAIGVGKFSSKLLISFNVHYLTT